MVDLGCGNAKTPGALGVDHWDGPGVDVVMNLDATPWALDENSFDRIVSNHLIEHVKDVVLFMGEIHRIGKPGARVEIRTPHFSSISSWQDPTHVRHLALRWYTLFAGDGYLAERTGRFQLVSTDVEFSPALGSHVGRVLYKLLGAKVWEKHFAFVWPARDLRTVLEIVK